MCASCAFRSRTNPAIENTSPSAENFCRLRVKSGAAFFFVNKRGAYDFLFVLLRRKLSQGKIINQISIH